MKVTLTRSVKREKSAVKELVTAAFEPKYEIKDHNLELTAKVTSVHDLNVGTSVRDLLGHGSKVEVNVIRSDRDGINGVALGSFKHESFALKAKVTYPFTPKKPVKISSEAVLHHSGSNSNLGIGVDVSLEGDSAHIFGEGVLSHSTHDAQYKGHVRYDVYDSTFNWGLSFWQKLSDKTCWAFEILSEEWAAKTTFTAGSEIKVNDSYTAKGKWKVIKTNDRVDYRFGTSLKHKMSPYVTGVIGADLNPRSFLGSVDGDPHSFGIEIKLQE